MPDQQDSVELNSILKSTSVGELTLKVRTKLDPSDTISAASALMRNRSHGSALVCEGEKLVGIFTERDMLKAIAGGIGMSTPISEVMTPEPQTVTAEASLYDAVQLMDTGGYRRVPVVNADGESLGIVDVKSVAHFLVEYYPATVYNQASHDQIIAKHAEGA